jgi:hypothetical protein
MPDLAFALNIRLHDRPLATRPTAGRFADGLNVEAEAVLAEDG